MNNFLEDEVFFGRKHRFEDDPKMKNEDIPSGMREEFLKWIDMKRRNEASKLTVTSPNNEALKKVNIKNEAFSLKNTINVVHDEDRNKMEFVNDLENPMGSEESKDMISDIEEEKECLNFPSMKLELCDDDKIKQKDFRSQDEENSTRIESSKPSETESNDPKDSEITLDSSPLEIKTSLLSSNFPLSLSSDKAPDRTTSKKRIANHSKGPAPPPPITSSIDEISGLYYDSVTKKHYKETEL